MPSRPRSTAYLAIDRSAGGSVTGPYVTWGFVTAICRAFENGATMASMVPPVRWRAAITVIWSADRPRLLADIKTCHRPCHWGRTSSRPQCGHPKHVIRPRPTFDNRPSSGAASTVFAIMKDGQPRQHRAAWAHRVRKPNIRSDHSLRPTLRPVMPRPFASGPVAQYQHAEG